MQDALQKAKDEEEQREREEEEKEQRRLDAIAARKQAVSIDF